MKYLYTFFLLLLSLKFPVLADEHQVDISGYEELTQDEFHKLVAGKSIKGTYRRKEYTESYRQDRTFQGNQSGLLYSGRWEAGENNCVVIVFSDGVRYCWKMLHNGDDYIFARYNSDGTVLTMSHHVSIVD